MDSLKIKDYAEQLSQLCESCKRAKKCKDHNKICVLKQFAFTLAKSSYKLKQKKERKNNGSC